MGRTLYLTVLIAALTLSCEIDLRPADSSSATLMLVRGSAAVHKRSVTTTQRIPIDTRVRVSQIGRARLHLDTGPRMLLDASSTVQLLDHSLVELSAGRAFIQVKASESLVLKNQQMVLRCSGAEFAAQVLKENRVAIHVISGEVGFTNAEENGLLKAGEKLVLSEDEVAVSASELWEDWTGGLARGGPITRQLPIGMGILEGRVPDELGKARWPLVVRRLDVRVTVNQQLAITSVQQVFFNPASEVVEGLYRFRTPVDAILQSFAVDRDGRLVEAVVREKAKARRDYQAQVYRGSTDDPALLEWSAPGEYRARIYPINAGETRRIVVRYAQWLKPSTGSGARFYRYPMAVSENAPTIQDFSLIVDLKKTDVASLRAGMAAKIDGDTIVLRKSDFRPRADFWLELTDDTPGQAVQAYRADHKPPKRATGSRAIINEADERDYFYLPVTLPAELFGKAQQAQGLDLVIITDVSAATDRSHLELGRSTVESLATHLSPKDRVSIVTSDLTIRRLPGQKDFELKTATDSHLQVLLDALARVPGGGATDLGAAITDASELIDPTRRSALIYLGDGAPTVGELAAKGLLEKINRLPYRPRFYSVAIGGHANLDLLSTLSRGSGLAIRVQAPWQAAEAALRILSHAIRPSAQQVQVDLGTGIDQVYPREPVDVVLGEPLAVVGRIRGKVPTRITVKGKVLSKAFTHQLSVFTNSIDASTDLRLRWANQRLQQLLLQGAGRESVAELGTRYGLITPYTSYYVPSAREIRNNPAYSQLLIPDRSQKTGKWQAEQFALAALGAMFSLAGCSKEVDSSLRTELAESDDSVNQIAMPEMVQEEAPAPSPSGQGKRHRDEQGEVAASSGILKSKIESSGRMANIDPHMARKALKEDAVQAGAIENNKDDKADPADSDDWLTEGDVSVGNEPKSGSWSAPTSPYGRDTALGKDPMSALGALSGDQTGPSFGGLGTRGTGRGGAGTGEGTIGLGNIGTIGRGAGGMKRPAKARSSRKRTTSSRIRTGTAEVRGSVSKEVIKRIVRRHINEIRFCYDQSLVNRPDLAGTVRVKFIIAPTGAVKQGVVQNSTVNHPPLERCVAQAVNRWTFPAPEGGGIAIVSYPFDFYSNIGSTPSKSPQPSIKTTVTTRFSWSMADHQLSHCSDAAELPLDDRRQLWRERLSNSYALNDWIAAFRKAARDCELSSWRARRAFLQEMLRRAGNIKTMLALYQSLSGLDARSFLRTAILQRVRSPADLKKVREVFLLSQKVDWQLVNKVLDQAKSSDAKIRALRQLIAQQAESYELYLRLIQILEEAKRLPEARRLAHRLRSDPAADARVRTAIGELFLRQGDPSEARRAFSEIVEFAPRDESARRRLGDLYRAYGWFDEAYRQYQTLAEIRPDDPSVMLLLAQAAAGAGRVDEALRLQAKLAETAEPGESQGLARIALLWSSVRFAKLRKQAREAGDETLLKNLTERMRHSGVLREAGSLRIALIWSHPDARISLWTAYPNSRLIRPTDIAPEYGIEALDVVEEQSGTYRVEVRRGKGELRTAIDAELLVIFNEGKRDEEILLLPIRFEKDTPAFAFHLEGRDLREVQPSADALAQEATL